MNTATERRRTGRQAAVGNVVEMEWWAGLDVRRSLGSILDVGQGGMRVESDECPPEGETVWFRVVVDDFQTWVAADVAWSGDGEVGVTFQGPCPDEVYLALTLGIGFGGLLG